MFQTRTIMTALLICFFCTASLGYGATDRRVDGEKTKLVYEIRNTERVDDGKTVEDASGLLIYGYVISARAVPQGADGTGAMYFQAKLSFFRPSRDMPGQTAGVWYLKGVWSIEPLQREKSQKETRRGSIRYRGLLDGTADFNPLQTRGTVTADLKVPTSLLDSGWLSGTGSFVGDNAFNGTITLYIDKPVQAEPVNNNN